MDCWGIETFLLRQEDDVCADGGAMYLRPGGSAARYPK